MLVSIPSTDSKLYLIKEIFGIGNMICHMGEYVHTFQQLHF